jgi:catechol 2,3-dioxygenase-like lactoylglutathione lyase family enzyme
MLLGLNHVTLRTSDFERCKSFYCGLLGMRVGNRPAFKVPGLWLYLGDSPVIHVLPEGSGDGSGTECAIDHFAFSATGLADFEQRLNASGVAFDLRQQAATQDWQMFISDPDGTKVELIFPASCEERF